MIHLSHTRSTRTPAKQTGLRQRSLRGTCRMGRATELVFVLATGAALMLGGAAQAQVTFTGDRSDQIASEPVTLIVPDAGDTFTQSGRVIASTRRARSGVITKLGAGTLILNNPENRSGDPRGMTFVNEGTLVMNGGVQPTNTFNVTVANGATLAGNGTITDLTVNSGGTLAPGALARGSIGTLTTNNVTLNAGSVLLIELDATSADRINAVANTLTNANGTVILIDATLHVADTMGDPTSGQVHEIISSAGGVIGSFRTITDDYAFFDPTVRYLPNAVTLTMIRNAATPDTVAQTPNQRAAATAVTALPQGNPISAALLPLTNAQAQEALDALSGEVHADVQGRAVEGANTLGGAVLDHLRRGGTTPGGTGPVVTVSSRGGDPRGFAGMQAAQPWVTLLSSAGTEKAANGFSRARTGSFGMVGGVDFASDGPWTFGVMLGLGQRNVTLSDRSSEAQTTHVALGLYAGRDLGPVTLSLGLLHDHGRTDTARNVTLGGVTQRLTASYTTDTTLAFAEISADLERERAVLASFLRLNQARITSGGFTETGGTAALTRAARTDDVTTAELGLRGVADLEIGGAAAQLWGGISYHSVVAGSHGSSVHGFAASGPAFGVDAALADRDELRFDLGLDVAVAHSATFRVAYTGSNRNRHQIGGSLTFRF